MGVVLHVNLERLVQTSTVSAMRIGLVIYGSLEPRSGGYLYDWQMAEYLRRRGDEVRVFSLPDRPYPAHLLDNANVRFWRRLARADLDLLVQDELNHASLCLGNHWLRRHTDVPIITIVHHLRASERRGRGATLTARFLERLYLQTTDARVYSSQGTKRTVEALVDRRPSVVAPPSGRRFGPPMSDRRIIARAKSGGPLRLVFVGNVVPRKRLHLLLDALAHVDTPRWTLDVIGSLDADPRYTQSIRQRICALNEPSRVALYGRLPDEALKRVLERSHVLTVPSAHEGYGIVYVEAMGRGLPVLASPYGGVREVVTDGETGRFADTPGEIAAAIGTWAANRRRLADMGRRAAKRYRSFPTWDDTCKTVATFLDHLVDSPSSTTCHSYDAPSRA